jgi:AhpC/TSA family
VPLDSGASDEGVSPSGPGACPLPLILSERYNEGMGARFALVVLLVLGGCDDDDMTPSDQGISPDMNMAEPDLAVDDLSTPDLSTPDLMPLACMPSPIYPAPPYGYREGRVIEDLVFQGKHDSDLSGRVDSLDPVATLSLHDYHLNPNDKLLVIVACAVWCGPCNAEQPSLNTLYNTYKSSGVAFLSVIMEGTTTTPATMNNLNNWGASKNVPYDLVIDPLGLLGPYFTQQAFPMQMLVRTSDMRIVWQNSGSDPALMQAQIDANLAGIADAGAPPPPPAMCDLGGSPPPPDGGTLGFCDSCTSDDQCPDGYVCASDTIGGHFCSKLCATNDDCLQNVAGYLPFETCVNDTGGKGMVCRPVGGACHGGGAVCDWCRPDVPSDCGAGLKCLTIAFTDERMCTEACTVDATLDGTTNTYTFSNDTCPAGSICGVGPYVSSLCGGPSCTLNGGCGRDPQRAVYTCYAPTPD